MGLVRFNADSSSNGGGFLHRLKPLPLPHQLAAAVQANGNGIYTPVYRSGGAGYFWEGISNTSMKLYSTYGATTVATVTYTTYLASSDAVCFHMSSADQCLYVLLRAGTSWRFIKISDTTGVVTTIGSAFTPTITANWPTTEGEATLEVDGVSGHLKLIHKGVYHLIHKTTGAIVSQDTTITVGAFTATRAIYVTQDGQVGVCHQNVQAYDTTINISALVHSVYGHTPNYNTGVNELPILRDASVLENFLLVDSNTILVRDSFGDIAIGQGYTYYSRTEWDKFIVSASELACGVI